MPSSRRSPRPPGLAAGSCQRASRASGIPLLIALAGSGAARHAAADLPCPVGPSAEVMEQDVSPPASTNTFGFAFAVEGDLLVVGDPQHPDEPPGSVAIFRRTGTTLTYEATLRPDDAPAGAHFGAAVAISGGIIAIGAPYEADESGAVYLFAETEDGWQQQERITEPIPVAGAQLGSALALDGDVLAVGAPRHSAAAGYGGAVLLVRRNGGLWTAQALLTADDAGVADRLGTSVALDGGRLLAGAPYAGDGGAALLFDTDSGAQLAQLTPAEGAPGALFGTSVALQGNRALVGAPQHSATAVAAGAAWLFERDEAGTWSSGAILVAPDAQPLDRFGAAVAIADNRLWISASHREPSGVVLGFREVQESWEAAVELFRADGFGHAGLSITVTDRHVFASFGNTETWDGVAAWLIEDCETREEPFICRAAQPVSTLSIPWSSASGVAVTDELFALTYVQDAQLIVRLRSANGGWGETQAFTGADTATGDWFGLALAANGGRAIVGAPRRRSREGGCGEGAAYVFERVGETMVQRALLEPPDPMSCTTFGGAIAIAGDRAAIGAVGSSTNQVPGVVYVFQLLDGAWALEAALTRPDGKYGDGFGRDLDMDGSFILAGAEGDGSASLFQLGPDGWSEVQRLVPAVPEEAPLFGRGVAIAPPRIAIGSRGLGFTGLVHTFRRDGAQWSPSAVIAGPSDFGWEIDLDADRLAVGSSNRGFVFGAVAGDWAKLVELRFDRFANNCRVDMHGSLLATGASLAGALGAILYETTSLDCNGNDLVDGCEIAAGLLEDSDGNGVPDTCETTVGDIDGDGAIGIEDLIAVILAWGPCPDPCPADVDGDGTVDVDDLLVVLLAWT